MREKKYISKKIMQATTRRRQLVTHAARRRGTGVYAAACLLFPLSLRRRAYATAAAAITAASRGYIVELERARGAYIIYTCTHRHI